MNFVKNKLTNKSGEKYLSVFIIAFVTAAIIFLPFMIMDRGYFLFYGDFNVQQIPFYMHAHDAVRSGNIFWDFYTDLGANFIGSYSFYLLGSPFFWLTIPFPPSVVPYLMAPLLWLKFAVAAVTAYGFITRFVKDKNFALIGGILYAFSGFSIYNVFFNHFHEAIAFFPLLLIALEESIVNDRKGVFALTVALNAISNYFFFAGQVVFLMIYFVLRISTDELKISFKQIGRLAFESIIGVMLSGFIMLPSYLAIAGNPRTSEFLSGWNFWLYNDVQRYPLIIQSFFFPPDIPARPNFFPDSNAKWSSVAGFLPLFSMAGVIAFCQSKKKNAFKRIILLCAFFALVPGLNSMFFMFNNAYYARWFYMLLLIMATVTVSGLEQKDVDYERGIKWAALVTAFFTFMVGLMPVKDSEGKQSLGLMDYPDRFWIAVIISVLSLALLYMLIKYLREHKQFAMAALSFTLVISVLYSIVFIAQGKANSEESDFMIDQAIRGSEKIDLPDDDFFRIDIYDSMDNIGLYWGYPNIQAFHSIVPQSVMEFYPSIGVERGVGSRPEISHLGLRSLVSVKYLFSKQDKQPPSVFGFSKVDNQNGFDIYENKNFVKMGFAYDEYLDDEQFAKVSQPSRDKVMMKAIYLSNEQVQKYGDLLSPISEEALYQLDDADFERDCANRRTQQAEYFEHDQKGFRSKITLSKENLVFFSVPYDEGWSATVNGKPVDVEKVNSGFMAVLCEQGDNEIRFTYTTPGLKTGIIISAIAVLLLLLYLLYFRYVKKSVKSQAALPTVHEEEELFSVEKSSDIVDMTQINMENSENTDEDDRNE